MGRSNASWDIQCGAIITRSIFFQNPHKIHRRAHIGSLLVRFMGPTWGPSGAPWTLLSGVSFVCPNSDVYLSVTVVMYEIWYIAPRSKGTRLNFVYFWRSYGNAKTQSVASINLSNYVLPSNLICSAPIPFLHPHCVTVPQWRESSSIPQIVRAKHKKQYDYHLRSFNCLFVSLLSHFWLIHFFHLYLLYQPNLGLGLNVRVFTAPGVSLHVGSSSHQFSSYPISWKQHFSPYGILCFWH